jgi:hypothetical protein
MRYRWNSRTCSSDSTISENSPIPVFVPYMISRAASFSSIMRRQTRIRSSAAGSSVISSPWRAMRTRRSMVSDDPSRTMDMADHSCRFQPPRESSRLPMFHPGGIGGCCDDGRPPQPGPAGCRRRHCEAGSRSTSEPRPRSQARSLRRCRPRYQLTAGGGRQAATDPRRPRRSWRGGPRRLHERPSSIRLDVERQPARIRWLVRPRARPRAPESGRQGGDYLTRHTGRRRLPGSNTMTTSRAIAPARHRLQTSVPSRGAGYRRSRALRRSARRLSRFEGSGHLIQRREERELTL